MEAGINLSELLRGLITNLFVLLGFTSVCMVVSGWAVQQKKKVNVWLVGLLYGGMSVIVMLAPVVTHSGLIVDCRAGVLGTAALLGGPQAALASFLFPCAYRISLGGQHCLFGLFEILLPGVLGSLCYVWYRRQRRVPTLRQVLVSSLFVGLGTDMVLSAVFLSGAVKDGAAEVGVLGGIAVVLAAPVSMALLSTLVVLEQRHIGAMATLAETERRMLHSQKMVAIGQLSYRVAHSILNSLTTILNDAELAKIDSSDPGQVHSHMDGIITTVDNVSRLTGELVAFAIPGPLRLRSMELGKCLVGIDRLLAKTIGKEIELVIDNGGCVAGTVHIDPNRIEQVIVHLAINASEAMSGHGRLTISVSAADLSEAERDRLQAGVYAGDRHHGRFAALSVEDTGCGMTTEVVNRIFEPFFTTKERHDNTGLGLPTVYTIVQQHRGVIDVKTRPGCGSTFIIYFPVIA